MLADQLGTPTDYSYIDMEPDYVSKYPPLFRQRIAIVAANHEIDNKNYNTALKIFDTLQPPKDTKQTADEKSEDLIGPIKPYVNYLFAKISSETGQEDSKNIWNDLASDYSNPFVQAHADFSKTIWEINHDVLTKDQAIDRLEHLRLSWHGDALELKILELLGSLYNEKKDYVNVMRIWDDAVSSFPSTTTAIEMAHNMRETFLLMFAEDSNVATSPMDALVLYYQYKNYAPSGKAGRDLADRLADKLVAMDLLDQAATLLDHQMRTEADKTFRSQIGAKVSKIYMMAHEPHKALKTLQDSVYGEIPVNLRLSRNLLTAQALFDIKEVDRAYQMIEHDDSLEAERLRLDIYWQRKDWPHVISTAEGVLKLRKDVSAPLNLEESDAVLKLGLAYIFHNDPTQLQYLHDYFGPLMANNPNKAVFEFITSNDVTPTPANFEDVMQNLSDTRSFIENYHAHVQMAGLKTGTPPNATVKQ